MSVSRETVAELWKIQALLLARESHACRHLRFDAQKKLTDLGVIVIPKNDREGK